MIDVHSHIVFDVDDGPKTLEESLDLIGESYAQGVRAIVSTSHRRKGMFETPEDKIFANFSKVKEEAEALYPDLTIYYGGELYYTSDIVEKLEKNLIPRMHNTQFALIEFSARTSWKEIHSGLSTVLRAGVTPIVAHIERYDALEENADRVREIINMGCYTQVNSSHVLKPPRIAPSNTFRLIFGEDGEDGNLASSSVVTSSTLVTVLIFLDATSRTLLAST